MPARLLFASGSIGGARALIPVIETAIKHRCEVAVLRHGYIVAEGSSEWRWLTREPDDPFNADALLRSFEPDVLIFGSSVSDATALTLARRAHDLGIRTIHVLDSWTDYRGRVSTDGLSPFYPDIFTVIDHLAFEGALEAGIPRATLHITGQPALSYQIQKFSAAAPIEKRKQKHVKDILFVSEPVEADQGGSPDHRAFRGYTESEVLGLLCNALQPLYERVCLSILPHPSEDEGRLIENWHKLKGKLDGVVLDKGLAKELLVEFDGIVGMASLLLYEAWLTGCQVLSLQPGLRQSHLKQIGMRNGVVLVNSRLGAEDKVRKWVSDLQKQQSNTMRPEAETHLRAPEQILSLAIDLAASR